MLFLAGIFAGIIKQSQDEGIWDAEWAKLHVDYLNEMREYGITLYEMAGPSLASAVGAPTSLIPLSRTQMRMQRAAEGQGTREALEQMDII